MEQFFVILAIAVFWLIRGGAEARKRRGRSEGIDWEPFEDSDGTGSSALEASIQAMEERAEIQAAEAMSRWESRQQTRKVKAVEEAHTHLRPQERERVQLRPAGEGQRIGLRKALRSIAATLPTQPVTARETLPVPSTGRTAGRAIERSAGSAHDLEKRPADPYAPTARPSESQELSRHPGGSGRGPRSRTSSTSASVFRRLESLPPLQRAIVFADIFGPPVALRNRTPGDESDG